MHGLNRSIGNPQQFSGHKHGAPAVKHMCSLHQNGWAAMGCQPSCVSPHSLFKLIGDRIERRTRAVAKRENWDTFRDVLQHFVEVTRLSASANKNEILQVGVTVCTANHSAPTPNASGGTETAQRFHRLDTKTQLLQRYRKTGKILGAGINGAVFLGMDQHGRKARPFESWG